MYMYLGFLQNILMTHFVCPRKCLYSLMFVTYFYFRLLHIGDIFAVSSIGKVVSVCFHIKCTMNFSQIYMKCVDDYLLGTVRAHRHTHCQIVLEGAAESLKPKDPRSVK